MENKNVSVEKTNKGKPMLLSKCAVYNSKLDEACIQHDKAYGDFKDLPRRTACDKVLFDKAFDIAIIPKYGYQRGFALMVL